MVNQLQLPSLTCFNIRKPNTIQGIHGAKLAAHDMRIPGAKHTQEQGAGGGGACVQKTRSGRVISLRVYVGREGGRDRVV